MNPPRRPGIFAINGGSSSIKFALFAADGSGTEIFRGSLERIGLSGASFRNKGPETSDNFSKTVTAPDYPAAVKILLDWVTSRVDGGTLRGVGHRVVHGGPRYSAPESITEKVMKELRAIIPFDPEHLPGELQLIAAFRLRLPDVPQVACFDTAFHHDLPRVARILPIPRRYEALGVRRYGFHGLSYAYLMEALEKTAGSKAARGRIILAHLGNGASLAAVRGGKPVDTSMSFTPTSGVPMGTRSGDLDPGLPWYLARTEGLDAKGFSELVSFQSGLLGLSETSSDMRDLLGVESRDVRAAEAIANFCYQVKKWIGSFAAALNGLDTLVFAGGIGERAASIRTRICDGLAFLGIKLDAERNTNDAAVISVAGSRVMVRVMRTDEERMIATLVGGILDLRGDKPGVSD